MMGPDIDFDPRVDYYKTLGIKKDASDAEIKKAYRELAKKYHPDATGGDKAKEARFKEVSTAYDVLGNKDKRAQYDAVRTSGFSRGGAPGGAGGFPGGAGGMGGFDLGDLFSQMFGGQRGGGPGGGPGGANVRYEVFTGDGSEVPFESLFGGEPRRQRTRRRPQRPQQPTERKIRAADGTTLTQRGTDVYSEVRLKLDEALLGTTKKVATLGGKATVKVPPGTSSGTKLRLRGKGVPRGGSGKRGDHYVTVQIDIPKNKLDARAQQLLAELMKKLQ